MRRKRFFGLTAITLGLIGLLLTCGTSANAAVTYHTANQLTIGHDAVTTLDTGDPVPAEDGVMYQTILRDRFDVIVSEGALRADTREVVTLINEGKYLVGVRAVRIATDGEVLSQSIIAWSDDPAYVANGETFGLKFYHAPATPQKLGKVRD